MINLSKLTQAIFITLMISISSVVLISISSHAQPADNPVIEQAEGLERFRAEQIRQQNLERRQLRDRAPEGIVPQAPDITSQAEHDICVPIDTISISGMSLLPVETEANLNRQYQGECIGLAQLDNILKQLTFLYVQRGFITSRAYLPEQDLSDGSLEVIVIEGKLDGFIINGSSDEDNRHIAMAFPGLLNRSVNLRDIEQGLDQINRLRSNNATIKLNPGKEVGSSILAVDVATTRPLHINISSDNLGSVATGEYQSKIDIGIDDILDLNDQWSFSYQRSMANHPVFFTRERPNSNSFNGSVSIPYGYWTFDLKGSLNTYYSEIKGDLSRIQTSGKSQKLDFNISRVIHRDQISKTTISGGLGWKRNENFVFGNRIDISSRALATVHISLTHSRQLSGGQASASLDYYHGIKAFGAFDDAMASKGSPKGQFDKISGQLSYVKPFQIKGSDFIYNTSISGQWSDDLLFGSEQMSLGGYSSIRGVRQGTLFGNNAIMMRNELSLPFSSMQASDLADIFGSVEPYLAFDAGHVFSQSQYNIIGGSLAGAAIGLRNSAGKFDFDLAYADLLYAPSRLSSLKAQPGVIYARMSMSF